MTETIQTEVGKLQVIAVERDILNLAGRNLHLNGVSFQMSALFGINGFTCEYLADSLTTEKTKVENKYRRELSAVSCSRLIEIIKKKLDFELKVRPEFFKRLQESYYRDKIAKIRLELEKKEEEILILKRDHERIQAELTARTL